MMQTTTIRKTLTFIFLKLAELGSLFGLTFGIYFLGRYVKSYIVLNENNWLNGLLTILLFLLIIILVLSSAYALYTLLKEFVMMNWKWATILNETSEERKEREKKEILKKKKEHIQAHGFWIGDKVKIIDPIFESEQKYKNKIVVVQDLTLFGHIKIKGFSGSFTMSQVKPVKFRKEKIKDVNHGDEEQ